MLTTSTKILLAGFVALAALPGCSKDAAPAADKATAEPAKVAPGASNKVAPGASNTEPVANEALPDRDPQLAKKLVAEGAVLLDVRSQAEWDGGHIEGATLIPVDEFENRLSDVGQLTGDDKGKPIVLYCRSGGRAGRAKKMLLKAGYTQVTNMGGISDWPKD